MAIFRIILIGTFFTLLMCGVTLKYYVDVCLPSRGSAVFPRALGAPSGVCTLLQEKDFRDRRELAEESNRKSLFERAGFITSLRNPRDVILMPTIFLSAVPQNRQLLGTGIIILTGIAFTFAFVFRVLSDIVSTVVGDQLFYDDNEMTEELKPTALDPGRKRRLHTTAHYELVGNVQTTSGSQVTFDSDFNPIDGDEDANVGSGTRRRPPS